MVIAAQTIVLDTGPLGLLVSRKTNPVVLACQSWAKTLEAAGRRFVIPEIADYELRRELIRLRKAGSIRLLDNLRNRFRYESLTTDVMMYAAQLWAVARQRGIPTAAKDSLDGDMILISQAVHLFDPSYVIASVNTRHLNRFAPSEEWQLLTP